MRDRLDCKFLASPKLFDTAFPLNAPFLLVQPRPTSLPPYHNDSSSDTQGRIQPDLLGSDVPVKNDASQRFSDADWSDTAQVNNFSGGAPPSRIPYRKPQFPTSRPDWTYFKDGNTATQASDSSPLPTADTADWPIDDDRSYRPKGLLSPYLHYLRNRLARKFLGAH
jgi:hypothetical protein